MAGPTVCSSPSEKHDGHRHEARYHNDADEEVTLRALPAGDEELAATLDDGISELTPDLSGYGGEGSPAYSFRRTNNCGAASTFSRRVLPASSFNADGKPIGAPKGKWWGYDSKEARLECRNVCAKQQWNRNYVTCLENSLLGKTNQPGCTMS
jgi:hypothetical protein